MVTFLMRMQLLTIFMPCIFQISDNVEFFLKDHESCSGKTKKEAD